MKITGSLIVFSTVVMLAGCAVKWKTVSFEQTIDGYDPSCQYRALVDDKGQHAGTPSEHTTSYFYPVYVSPERLIFASHGDNDAILYRLALPRGESIAKSIEGDSDYLTISSLQVYCARVE